MTKSKLSLYLTKLRRSLIKQFGGVCMCSPECKETRWLQFAHIKPTLVSGLGRGKAKRIYDVIHNPDCYILLALKCHKKYDQEHDLPYQGYTPKALRR